LLILVAALLLATAPCRAEPVQVTDDSGHRIVLAQPARRVVSLAPNLTELAFAAGGGAHVVGVGRYSNAPAEARQLPVVGDAFALNLEAIAALKPDLILLWRSGTAPRQRERLQALGVPVFESEISRPGDIADTLLRLGALMGTAPQAQAAAAAQQQRWQGLGARYQGRPTVRVFYETWHQPLMTLNREHLIHAALSLCGGVNPFATLPALTPTISLEAAVHADPQLIVTSTSALRDVQAQWAPFKQVSAVRQQRIVGLDADLLTRMGPRFVDGAEQLCAAIDAARH
jgi:iron complex transport system substrate-binding protein